MQSLHKEKRGEPMTPVGAVIKWEDKAIDESERSGSLQEESQYGFTFTSDLQP